ncbi:MAG: polyprenyl synthetase family protein [Rhodocyclaceae bacterium]|jgi:farnesyl diphosphate synthase|nr:polyprenyl synthetase family protein [Rhodocyclaceae bacterium]
MSDMSTDFLSWMSAIQARTEQALDERLPAPDQQPCTLHQAMRYAVLGGGKRVRALLVHATGAVTGATPDSLDAPACALELIHAYSLVHDDMPCMDDDVLRRGKPTVHVEFDQATALLCGDALQTLAFELLAREITHRPAERSLTMLAHLATASGSRGMAGGQAIDLASVGHRLSLEALEMMHIHKTGALIRAAVLLGAHAGPPVDEALLQRLDRYGKLVGLLFQVVDDVLDAQADTATLGKTAGKDAEHDKPTYVSLLGLEEARSKAEDLLRQACDALAPLGPKASHLEALARYITHRKY